MSDTIDSVEDSVGDGVEDSVSIPVEPDNDASDNNTWEESQIVGCSVKNAVSQAEASEESNQSQLDAMVSYCDTLAVGNAEPVAKRPKVMKYCWNCGTSLYDVM